MYGVDQLNLQVAKKVQRFVEESNKTGVPLSAEVITMSLSKYNNLNNNIVFAFII